MFTSRTITSGVAAFTLRNASKPLLSVWTVYPANRSALETSSVRDSSSSTTKIVASWLIRSFMIAHATGASWEFPENNM